MKSGDQRCILICDIGFANANMINMCKMDENGKRVWMNRPKAFVCEETVVVAMGGNPTSSQVQMYSLSETRQLPDFYETEASFLQRGTVVFAFGRLQFYATSADNCLSISYKFDGPRSGTKVNSSISAHIHTSIKMDKIYLLSEQETGVVVEQIEMHELANNVQVARKMLTIDIGDGITGNLGCAARFSDTSFLYISGTKAVEINIVSRNYKILPGELNLARLSPGCDVIQIGGIMTTLVGGGEDGLSRKTSEYYDKKSQTWKFTSGNFTNPRYCYLFRFSDSNLVEESIEMEILLFLFFTPSRSCFIFN